jgi:glutamyl-tRNA reductase
LLSTCHRTELYWWGDEDLGGWFSDVVCGEDAGALQIERADADLAVRHLFAVAAGMKSVRFGEPEILGQIRRAWVGARSAGAAYGELDDTFRRAVDAARYIRSVMGSDADASLGDRVHDRLAAYTASLPARPMRLLLVGSGDAARGVLEALQRRPLREVEVTVTSRTTGRAESLAIAYGAGVIPWAVRNDAIAQADMVVFAVHVTAPLVDAEMSSQGRSGEGEPLWVDLGVPGAVGKGFTSSQVQLLRLSDLEASHATVDERIQRRRRAEHALQRELSRYARASYRSQLGARLGTLEEQAIAVATAHRHLPTDEVARRVTRLVLRELIRG